MLPIDAYPQADVADPVLDEQTVLNLARRHVISCAAVSSIDESGGEARTYSLDDNLVLKVQRPHRRRHRTSLEKEVFFLNQPFNPQVIFAASRYGYLYRSDDGGESWSKLWREFSEISSLLWMPN